MPEKCLLHFCEDSTNSHKITNKKGGIESPVKLYAKTWHIVVLIKMIA